MKKHKFIPVFFHNLASYDERLFLRELGWEPGKIDCIAKNAENFISFSKEIVVDWIFPDDGSLKEVKREIRFLDTFKFMSASLSNLVDNLDDLPFLKKEFPDPKKFELVKYNEKEYSHTIEWTPPKN